MINRLLLTVLFLILNAASFGQQLSPATVGTSFQGLTPGQSTRADVEKVLGPPVEVIVGSILEYKPPQGIKSVTVYYHSSSEQALVDEIRVFLVRPVSRSALIEKFKLSSETDICNGKMTGGDLEEIFGGQALLVFTYKSGDPNSGVIQIKYCGPGKFSVWRASYCANKN